VLAIQRLIFLKIGGGGIRTPLDAQDILLQNADKSATEITQTLANTDTYETPQDTDFEQLLTVPEHSSDTFLHQKCAKCVHKNSLDDLTEIINKWADLPESVREAIKLLVRSAGT
jgi:hypothetical protein